MINLDIVTKSSTISDFYPEYLVQSPSVTPGKVRIGLQIRKQPRLWRTKKRSKRSFCFVSGSHPKDGFPKSASLLYPLLSQ